VLVFGEERRREIESCVRVRLLVDAKMPIARSPNNISFSKFLQYTYCNIIIRITQTSFNDLWSMEALY
jgi:hypothetical protein